MRSASVAGSVVARAPMDEPVKRLALALVGAVALTAERADELADSLAERGGMSRDEVRGWIDEATTRWRGDAVRVGERAGATMHGALRELGLVTREEWDELELRVAQLEHRLRLVETKPQPLAPSME
jgi:polyhydroxyalkanoate synthesis regulator phasin